MTWFLHLWICTGVEFDLGRNITWIHGVCMRRQSEVMQQQPENADEYGKPP